MSLALKMETNEQQALTLELSREQKIQMMEKLGINADSLTLKSIENDMEIKVSDYNDNMFIVCSDTWAKS